MRTVYLVMSRRTRIQALKCPSGRLRRPSRGRKKETQEKAVLSFSVPWTVSGGAASETGTSVPGPNTQP